jgi:arabinose-5-phosphate isomerase
MKSPVCRGFSMGWPTLEAGSVRAEAKAEGSIEGRDRTAVRRVLKLEAQGLLALAESLGAELDAAVARLAETRGRVIVTGMGKSGHVARKIAATFASTGTPAHFVHPGEASHGDLGMIAPGDSVLALSNSGETPELNDVVTYTRRFSVPLIAVVGRAPSALADAADVALVLPKVVEACPLGLAPTTSTTMMLALGDALAIALLTQRGFTADDYRVLHPGGRLGAKLLKVADIMHTGKEVPLVGPNSSMADALLVMTARTFGCVGIVEPEAGGGRLIGMFTDGDLRRHMSADLLQRKIAEVMTRTPKTIGPGLLAVEALKLMQQHGITRFFVVDSDPAAKAAAGRPIGFVHFRDLLSAGVL